MPNATHCPECGAPLPADSPKGLCSRCALQGALEVSSGETQVLHVESSTDASSTHLAEKPGERVGRYKLLQKIGEGGCGVVYMAEQEEPVRRRVALKIIKLGMDTRQVIARFEAERQALAMMDHPNIAKIFDAGVTQNLVHELEGGARHSVRAEARPSESGAQGTDAPYPPNSVLSAGRPYFVMELVRGVKITAYCDENNLPTRDRLDLFIKVCQAVQHAHQKGIIHRDLKPSNILVTINDDVAVPKVIDFGVAKATGQQRLTDKTLFTAFEQFIGTPAYMSPEQALMTSLDIDTRSDIYSLGVLLYEMLTSKTPFDTKELMAAGLDEIRRTIREQEPARPSTRLSTMLEGELIATAKHRQSNALKLIHLLRGDLDWIVMKALEKDRTRRYATANAFAADIERHLTNEPVLARPPSTAYRFQKAFRRNKLAFAAASAVALTLLGGLSFSTWSFLRERKAHASEAAQRRTAVEQQTKAEAAQASEAEQRSKADGEKITAQRHLYVANMNLAQQAWEQNNMGRLRQLLDETQESPNRGFEWYYWQRQTHLELKTLRGHVMSVTSVAFSPDGQRIFTGSGDRTKVWEAASGRELLTLKGPISPVAFSPDGQRIVSRSRDQTAKVWDTASGQELLTLKGHTDEIYSVAWSPDGQRIVTGSDDQTAKVWEAASGRELLTLKGHTDWIRSVAFSPNGQRIVTGSYDKKAKVWEAASGRELLTLQGHSRWINSVAFSMDGQRIVTGSEDMTAKVWEAASGRELLTLQGHSAPICSVAFSPDGQRIVTASGGVGTAKITAKVWEAASGQELFTLRGHSRWINSVAFSPDGQRIVTGSGDQTAKVWDAASGRESLTLHGSSASIYSVAFSPDSQRIVTGSQDQTAKVWEAATGRELLTLKGHSSYVMSAIFSPDGQRIVTGSLLDQTGKVWDAASGRELFTLNVNSAAIYSVAFSPDGQRIVTGHGDYTAKVWDAASGRELLTLNVNSAAIHSVAFSPDGQRIVTSGTGTAKVWDAASGQELLTLKGHSAGIWSVAFSPDGQRIVTGSFDHTAKVWEAASGRELRTLNGHSDVIRSVAFSPDSQRIVTGSDDHTAKVWEAASGRELLTLQGHSAKIYSVAFSPDGQRIVTGSVDHTAKVWEAARAEQVAAWQEEEQAAEQHLATLRREQTAELAAENERQRIAHIHAEGAIKRWLILAPIPLATKQSGPQGLDVEQIEGENRLRPKAGETASTADGELKWREVAQDDYVIDFNVILGGVTEMSVAYAVCYILSETEQRDLQMLVGSDDETKVYLNGKQIYKHSSARLHAFIADQAGVNDIVLNAGLNVLVFKLVNEEKDWKGSIRFAKLGKPVKGIKVTLDPDAKDSP